MQYNKYVRILQVDKIVNYLNVSISNEYQKDTRSKGDKLYMFRKLGEINPTHKVWSWALLIW